MKCLHTCFSRIKSLAITLAMPQVFKYQQPNLFLVRWCTVHVARRGWLQRHIIIHHQSAELWGTILLRSGPSARYALVPSEYVPVYAVSTLLRISRDVVRLETLRLKEILIVVKNKKKRNLFSKQLRYNWKKNQCFITWTLALSKKDVRWNFLCSPDHPMRIFVET